MSQIDIQNALRTDRISEQNSSIVFAVLILSSFIVNALSRNVDHQILSVSTNVLLAWIDEGSSAIATCCLLPLLGYFNRIHPIAGVSKSVWIPKYIIASLAFSLLHILGMKLIRLTIYPIAVGQEYSFHANVFETFFYEYRKDLITFSILMLGFMLSRELEHKKLETSVNREDAKEKKRITIKCGGRTIWINAEDVIWAKAAANYVEIRTADKTLLARSTLANIEEQLQAAGVEISRVHRSYIIDASKVREISPTGEGDARIQMIDDEIIPGSRRYKNAWPSH
ncbi:LytR/AlgR family response regulator transcription factor [Hirschia baltica]|uniref:Response regulator receiver protein n=1 Tax=Hirschia baltica (strain ATCC 49814 / DSM 5838 / IFAM 1418) TaxID=582402 RepID=C6XMK7_HIRBI|nr:LytTR family DNA-binding domain-containing protein [Hirschia baltica]ACT59921.1 response regulator receiver protein [Hirschia baltica ATCC 49814]